MIYSNNFLNMIDKIEITDYFNDVFTLRMLYNNCDYVNMMSFIQCLEIKYNFNIYYIFEIKHIYFYSYYSYYIVTDEVLRNIGTNILIKKILKNLHVI